VKRFFAVISGVALAIPAVILGAEPAAAASGRVVVFETEVQELSTYDDPSGCTKLPAAAHVLLNLTDEPVKTYGDPLCLVPSLTVEPGYGAHVPPATGSFSAG
jgi:hypothetical protein